MGDERTRRSSARRVRRPVRRRLCGVLLAGCVCAAGASAGGGCHYVAPAKWGFTTEYQFVGASAGDRPIIESVFRKHDAVYRRTAEAPLTYEVTNVATFVRLELIHKDLDRAVRRQRLDLRPDRAVLRYGGIALEGGVGTTVSVEVTPGAVVHIADGTRRRPWRRVTIEEDGTFSGSVDTTGVVADTGGWVYIHARVGDLARVWRVNVLSKERSRYYDDLPFAPPREGTVMEGAPGVGGG